MRAWKNAGSGDVTAKNVEGMSFVGYANKHLKRLGCGTSRVTYAYGSRFALKVAFNDKGIAQNEAEVDIYTSSSSKRLVTRIYDFDDDYRWIIAEIVREVHNVRELENMLGIEFGSLINFRDVVTAAAYDDRDYVLYNIDDKARDTTSKFMDDLYELIVYNKLETSDIEVASHCAVGLWAYDRRVHQALQSEVITGAAHPPKTCACFFVCSCPTLLHVFSVARNTRDEIAVDRIVHPTPCIAHDKPVTTQVATKALTRCVAAPFCIAFLH